MPMIITVIVHRYWGLWDDAADGEAAWCEITIKTEYCGDVIAL